MIDCVEKSALVENNRYKLQVTDVNKMKSFSSPKIFNDSLNSISLPNSPSRDNVSAICSNTPDNSLSNSWNDIDYKMYTKDFDGLVTNFGDNENISSKSPSKFSPKRKKSALFSGISNYENKTCGFKKIFANTLAIYDQLLADFSCALAKNPHGVLIQGRLYVTENWICFYSKIMTFENKIILPISTVTSVTKEKTVKVIPNAIRITTSNGKYFFTSFGSREKTFNLLQRLLVNHKGEEVLSTMQKQNIIQEYYGNVGYSINEECFKKFPETPENKINGDEISGNGIANFVIGDETDTDTEQSQISSNVNHSDENGADAKSSTNQVYEESSIVDANHCSHFLPKNSMKTSITAAVRRPLIGECRGHEHFQRCYLDEELHMDVDRLFTCLFTNSSFFKHFCEARKTMNVIQVPWPDIPDLHGGKERTIFYTLTLKAKIGPKESSSEERQYIHGSSEPGNNYLVDTTVRNSGFPLSDSFHCINRYCLISISPFKSRIKVTSQIVYDKQLFFPSKSVIDATSKSGLTDYFSELGASLKREACIHPSDININIENVLPSVTTFRNKSSQSTFTNVNSEVYLSETKEPTAPNDIIVSFGSFFQPERAWLILIVLSLIICLCLSFLYSRFRQLEEITNMQINIQRNSRQTSDTDWKSLFIKQNENQIDEISQWKIVVENSIDLIDQMKKVLVTIKLNLEKLENEVKATSLHGYSHKSQSSPG